jgi:hypothetical protein
VFHLRCFVPALFLLLSAAQLANGQVVAIIATIDEIDAKKGLIAVKTDLSRGVLKVTDKSQIKKNGKQATIDDLEVGEVVQVAYSRQTGVITNLIVGKAPPKNQRDVLVAVLGRVAEVDVKRNLITVNRRVDGAEFVLKVSADSRLLDDGLRVKLSDIKKGQRVKVTFLKKQKYIAVMYLLDTFE